MQLQDEEAIASSCLIVATLTVSAYAEPCISYGRVVSAEAGDHIDE